MGAELDFGHRKNESAWQHYYRGLLTTLPSFLGTVRLTPQSVLHPWVFRYGCRRGAINAMTLRDRDVVVARNRAKFGVSNFTPQYHFINILPDPLPGRVHPQGYYYDLRFVEANHPEYGPLLQSFVEEADCRRLSEAEMCQLVLDWSLRMPPRIAELEKVQTLPRNSRRPRSVALIPYFESEVIWRRADDLDRPWSADIAGKRWVLHLNDFPDEILYSLFVEGTKVDDFNDFPKSWKRSSRRTNVQG